MWLEQFIIEKTVASKIAANKWKGLLRGVSRPFLMRLIENLLLKAYTPVYSSYPSVQNDDKMKPNTRGYKKCGKTPIATGALSKGLQLCWECYKEEISSMFEY